MAAFLRAKGQILWDVTVDTGYVQPMNFLAPGSRDMFDANNKAVDYLFHALCQPEFGRVRTEHLACRIWSVLKEAHVGNAQVQARMYATYQREYENFTHLPGESIDALFQRFTVTPGFKGKTECIDHVCARIKLHTRLDIVNTKISATQIESHYKP
jgi:hypothetical protein